MLWQLDTLRWMWRRSSLSVKRKAPVFAASLSRAASSIAGRFGAARPTRSGKHHSLRQSSLRKEVRTRQAGVGGSGGRALTDCDAASAVSPSCSRQSSRPSPRFVRIGSAGAHGERAGDTPSPPSPRKAREREMGEIVTCMMIWSGLSRLPSCKSPRDPDHAAQELRFHVLSHRSQPGAGGGVVEHPDPAGRVPRADAVRPVPEEPGHRAEHADAAAECPGRERAAGAAGV